MKGVSNMKSTFKYLFTLLAIYLLSVGSVLADPALVIRIDGCGLFDGDGNPVILAGTGVTVSAQNANGNVTHTCSAEYVPPPSSGRTAVYNADSPETFGLECGLDDGLGNNLAVTDDWHEVITKQGKAKLVCQFHN
jgi:hypothetical protein